VSAALAGAAVAGWVAAISCALALRRRLALVARAEHELRSPLAALSLAAEAARRRPRPAARADVLVAALDVQLARASAGLEDLAAARRGTVAPARPRAVPLGGLVRASATGWEPLARREQRSLTLDWRAGGATVRSDPARLAQALGNLLSNAVEHGRGPVVVRGRRSGRRLRVEVGQGETPAGVAPEAPVPIRPPHAGPRGHGLSIAAEAAERAGGRLTVAGDGESRTYALELPEDTGA
jgi:signal transduction histidine kinase